MRKIVHPKRYWTGAIIAAVGALLAILGILQEVVDIGLGGFPVRGPAAAAMVVLGAGIAVSSIERSDPE